MPWLLALLLNVCIIGLIIYVIFWAINYLGVPDPIRKVIVVILVVIFVIYIVGALSGGVIP